jgi:hypothetical protein
VKLPRQARWAVPGGAVVAVGLVIAGAVMAGAQTTPRLPARTTGQLLAAVGKPSATPPAMTAVVQETASLGLPDLPGSSDPLSPLSLLSGTHTFKIWYGGPARVRVAAPVSLGETDLRVNGNSAWLWNSRANTATHYLLPASPASGLGAPPPAARVGSIPTPQQLARQILAAVGPTTTVGLQQNVNVAGRAAYQLSLAPKDSRSLIGRVQVAIDAQTSLPLRVQVFARGASGPAVSVGYTSLSFGAPAASNFSFSPPSGAKVKTVRVPAASAANPMPAGTGSPSARVVVVAPGTGSVVVSGSKQVSAATAKQMEAAFAQTLPASLSKTERAELVKQFAGQLTGKSAGAWTSNVPIPPPSASASSISSSPAAVSTGSGGSASLEFLATGAPEAAPRVIGKGWLSVAVLPGGFTAHGGFAPQTGTEPGVPDVLGALVSAATPVHGAWGSGRLLRTGLVSVLMTDKGDVLVGAVVPSVLYADAAQLG